MKLAPLRSVVGLPPLTCTLNTGVRLPSFVGNGCVWISLGCLLSDRFTDTCWNCCCRDRSLSSIVDRRVGKEFPSSVIYANPEPAFGLFSLAAAFLLALNAAWMNLSTAALVTDIIALSFFEDHLVIYMDHGLVPCRGHVAPDALESFRDAL